MKLRTIGHSRSGDKGSMLNISLIAFDERDYPRLVRHVTASRVKALFADSLTARSFGTSCRRSVRSISCCTG